jgi:tetratricopeptide (TPR) repeat protein
MKRFTLAAAFGIAMALSPAMAADDIGYAAIAKKDWQSAEAQLRAELASTPDEPMRMLNLAYVLQQQGRSAEAADIYRKVLAAKSNPMLAVGPDGKIKGMRAKAVAGRGMELMQSAER